MNGSVRNVGIRILVERMEGDKDAFLSALRTGIIDHVRAKKPSECLKLVTRYDGKEVVWSFKDNVDYVLRLTAYLRRRPFVIDGRTYEVDSVLTGEVLDLVLERFSEVILSHQGTVADVALTDILSEESTRDHFLDIFLAGKSAHLLTARGKSMVGGALLHGMQEKISHLSTAMASNIGEKVAHLMAGASKSALVTGATGAATKLLATTSGKVILAKLTTAVAHSLAPIVTKLLAMPVIQASLKKIVITAVLGTIAKFIAAKIGMTLTSAVWIVLTPILIALLYKDWSELPEKLGVSLADAVCGDLKESYSRSVNEIMTDLIAGLTTREAVSRIAESLGDDPLVTAEVGRLIGAVAGECAT